MILARLQMIIYHF